VFARYIIVSTFLVEYESGYYGDGYLNFEAWYERPETDEEYAARLAAEEESLLRTRRINEVRERQIYEQLKAKFG